MAINFGSYPIIYTPELVAAGYSAGDILFTPDKVYNFNKLGQFPAKVQAIGIFWDVGDAPEIDLFLFNDNPESWGTAGNAPAPNLADRAKLVGEWSVDGASDQGYGTMLGDDGNNKNYALVSGGLLCVLNSNDQEGYLTATTRTAYSDDLTDKLTLTFILEFNR